MFKLKLLTIKCAYTFIGIMVFNKCKVSVIDVIDVSVMLKKKFRRKYFI